MPLFERGWLQEIFDDVRQEIRDWPDYMKPPERREKTMATIIINGNRIDVPGGRNVVVKNNQVFVDGQEVASGLSGIVKIRWEGPLANLDAGGSVECGDVHGKVSAGGSVECREVGGSVSAGGSVRCGNVGGGVSAGGSVKMGRSG